MLPRVLEPEVMESAEEARDYDAMDHAAVNRVFIVDFIGSWDGKSPVLDVGTGTAQIPLGLCRQAPHAQVVGVDLAEQMLIIGQENLRRANAITQIRLERADAKHLPHADGSFAAVMSNSIVHHIPEPAEVLAEMSRVTADGGLIFVRDLLRPADDEAVRKLVAMYAGAASRHQEKMFEDSLRAALTLDEIRRLVTSLGHDRSDVRQTTDRHWTWRAHKVLREVPR